MDQLPIIFADLDDLIRIGLIVLFLLGPALGKFLKQPQPQKPPRPRVPGEGGPQRPPRNQPAGGGLAGPPAGKPVPGGRDALESEIEEFLKRASGKPAPRKPAQQAQPAVKRLAEPAVRQIAQPRRPLHRRVGEGVAEHVRQHIESDPVSDHSRDLGKSVGLADERVEGHLHDVFDHDLGQLEKRSTSRPQDDQIQEGTDDRTWETQLDKRSRRSDLDRDRSLRIVEMLRDPSDVRDAIILGEILKPPIGLS